MCSATGSCDRDSGASDDREGDQALCRQWMLIGEGEDRKSSDAYCDALQAIDFACTVLKQNSASIWIEGRLPSASSAASSCSMRSAAERVSLASPIPAPARRGIFKELEKKKSVWALRSGRAPDKSGEPL